MILHEKPSHVQLISLKTNRMIQIKYGTNRALSYY